MKISLWNIVAGAAIFSGLITMNSCAKGNASDVNQNKIYTYYDVFYNENSDKTSVSARFQFAGPTGTNLQLDGGSYVLFGTDTLPYNWLLACHYKEYAGRINTGTFRYVNTEGDAFVNSIPTSDTIGYQPSFTQIQKSVANTITWTGNPLAANEYVNLFIGTWSWGDDALQFQDGDGATNLILGTNQIADLTLGSATVYMDRKIGLNVTQKPAQGGGTITNGYRPVNKVVQVVP